MQDIESRGSKENCYSLRRNTRITRAIELIPEDVAIHDDESGDLSLYILPYYHVTTTESNIHILYYYKLVHTS